MLESIWTVILTIAVYGVVLVFVGAFVWDFIQKRRKGSEEKTALKPFRGVASRFPSTAELRTLRRTESPYIQGKVLPLELKSKKVNKWVYFGLPIEIRPASPEEVDTILWIDRREEKLGRYDNGEPYVRQIWDIRLVDVRKLIITAETKVQWDPPTLIQTSEYGEVRSYGGSFGAQNLDAQVVAYVKNLGSLNQHV